MIDAPPSLGRLEVGYEGGSEAMAGKAGDRSFVLLLKVEPQAVGFLRSEKLGGFSGLVCVRRK
jgi:hypothetical protein